MVLRIDYDKTHTEKAPLIIIIAANSLASSRIDARDACILFLLSYFTLKINNK